MLFARVFLTPYGIRHSVILYSSSCAKSCEKFFDSITFHDVASDLNVRPNCTGASSTASHRVRHYAAAHFRAATDDP